jgi:hypothetical protein
MISSSSSLVEIAGSYCHQCNPGDIEDIANQLELVLNNGNLQKIQLDQWKDQWSWLRCAEKTIQSYKSIEIC